MPDERDRKPTKPWRRQKTTRTVRIQKTTGIGRTGIVKSATIFAGAEATPRRTGIARSDREDGGLDRGALAGLGQIQRHYEG